MVVDLRYFNSLEHKVDSLKSQLETQKTQFLNEIDRLSKEYYYVDHINAILGVYTTLDEFTDLQCDYVDQVVKCERIEKELLKSNITSKSFEALQQHAIDLELALQQCQEQIKNDKAFKENQSNSTTSVSRPQLKRNQLEDRVMHNNSVRKKQEVEDHRRNFRISNNKMSVTGCNDSLNAKTSNVNFVCATCGKCVLNDNHDMCLLHYINGMNSRTKMPMAVLISTRKPKRTMNLSAATPLKRTVAAESTNQKPRSTIRKQYEQIRNPLYQILHRLLILLQLVAIILFIIDSGCSKHMTGNLKLLSNFVEKLLGTVKFGNDQISPILGYGDLVQGNTTIKRVYYVEGLNHNLFSVGQFYDADLEVAFRKSTCYIRDLKGNDSHRRNRTLVDVARTMLSATKVPLFFWADAIATTCFTQNRLLVIPRHKKTPYHIINGRKPSVKFFYIFRSLCYIVRDGENLDKIKEKDNVSSDPVPQCLTMALEHASLSPGLQSQENVPHSVETITTSNELDLLFTPMFDELLNGTTLVVSKSFVVTTADATTQRQQQHTTPSTSTTVAADIPPLNIQTTPKTTSQAPTQAPTVIANEYIIQTETNKEYAQVDVDKFINIFSIPLETDGEICMFTLTVSRTKPKNIKEAMADSAWIEAMQEELHQFD
ncbi:integrase, catalytic region, zinc finger, CCHC-type containing protein [Tanacetum coccineum]